MEPIVGQFVDDRYRILRRLGEGGMGSVWLARDMRRHANVALKFVAPLLTADADAIERFAREVRITLAFDHPNVVRALGEGTLPNGERYLVVEHVAGEDLGARIARTGKLSLSETRSIVAQTCRALCAMHDRGVVHRDIKPANILLGEDFQAPVVKIADFGLAREQGAAPLTQFNTVVGTPAYMSPERLGERDVTTSSDLWSLAVVAYECLVGRPPFDGPSYGAICLAIGQGKLKRVTRTRRGLPSALDAWFARALHERPDERFASAEELGETFAAACEGARPVSDRPSTRSVAVRVRRALQPLIVLFTGATEGSDASVTRREVARTVRAAVPVRG